MAKALLLVVWGIILVLRPSVGQSVRETFLLRRSLRKLIKNELRSSDLGTSLRDKYVRTLYQLSAFPLKRNYTTVDEPSEEITAAQARLTTARTTAALGLGVGCLHKVKGKDCVYNHGRVTRGGAIAARAVQCSKFNGTNFNGHTFEWVPYLRVTDSNECELNCLAKGYKFFLRLLPRVEDGTPCLTDLTKICIDGKCQAPPIDCPGGNCYSKLPTQRKKQKQFGIFTAKDIANGRLVLGYNPLITIPVGSTRINVTEMHKSRNYLALKSHNSNKYYINGNWVIDLPKAYRVAGTTVHYTRPKRNRGSNEAFVIEGPTTEALDVMLLYQQDEPYIMYSYYLSADFPRGVRGHQPSGNNGRPVEVEGGHGPGISVIPIPNSRNVEPQNRYEWKLGGYTQCSHSCAGGRQRSVYHCVRLNDRSNVPDENCAHGKPAPRERVCNLLPCPPYWRTPDAWKRCSKSCGSGIQIRNVLCKQLVDSNGRRQELMIQISNCPASLRPPVSRLCNLGPCPKPAKWAAGEWNQCSKTCGQGAQSRPVTCTDDKNVTVREYACQGKPKPATSRLCNAGSCNIEWFSSAHWTQCSTGCGRGQKSRHVFCARKGGNSMPERHCSRSSKPKSSQACNQGSCQAIWLTSPWSKCSVECGRGSQTRVVICAGMVGGTYQEFPVEACQRASKPPRRQACGEENCPPQWFSAEFTKCSRRCGGGYQKRHVMCMNHKGQMTGGCEHSKKPRHRKRCNTDRCPTSNPSSRPPCADRSKGMCMYVIRANFCQFGYYRKMCCESCSRQLAKH